ncbi:MAG: ATP-binding protein [Planctomycetales bacterium]
MTSPSNDGMPPIVRDAPSNLMMAEWSQVSPNLQETLRSAIRETRWPIVMHGPAGTGKSCASACIFCRWPKSERVHWYRLEEFVRDIVQCRKSPEGHVRKTVQGQAVYRTEATLWSLADETAVLWCLDDFGTRTVTEAGFDIVYQLIDRRTAKPTIVTSNLSLREIADLHDDRVADRLKAGSVIEVTGQSRRIGKRYRVE